MAENFNDETLATDRYWSTTGVNTVDVCFTDSYENIAYVNQAGKDLSMQEQAHIENILRDARQKIVQSIS